MESHGLQPGERVKDTGEIPQRDTITDDKRDLYGGSFP